MPKAQNHLYIPNGLPSRATRSDWNRPGTRLNAYQHMREFVPSVPIRVTGDGKPLPRARGFGSPVFGGRRAALQELLDATRVSGLMILQHGEVRVEAYRNGMTPNTIHLLWSISKSIVSSVAGILIDKGFFLSQDLVVDRLPELRDSGWDGITVRHLLDMRGGLRWKEDAGGPDDLLHERVYMRSDALVPPLSALEYLARIPRAVSPGAAFHYQSIMTDMLAWIIEAATRTRLPELISDLIWRPMGARVDAEISVDFYGNPMADAGISASLEDLSRFGEVWRNGGRLGGRQIIPEWWIADTVRDSTEARAAFGRAPDSAVSPRLYRNNWIVLDPNGPFYAARGYLGQSLHIHQESGLVVSMVGAWEKHETVLENQVTEIVLRIADTLHQ